MNFKDFDRLKGEIQFCQPRSAEMSTSSRYGNFDRFEPDTLVCFDCSECPAVLSFNPTLTPNFIGRSRGEGKSPDDFWLYRSGFLTPASQHSCLLDASQSQLAQPWYFVPKQTGLKTFRIANSQGLLISFTPATSEISLLAENVTSVKTSLKREPVRNEWIWLSDLRRFLTENSHVNVEFPVSDSQLKLIFKARHVWSLLDREDEELSHPIPDLRPSCEGETDGFPIEFPLSAGTEICREILINLDIPEDQKWAMISNPFRNVIPTGLYAPPGHKVKIRLIGDTDGLKIHLFLFCCNDVISDKAIWLRPPQVCIREVLSRGENKVKSPYGGPIVVYVEGSKKGMVARLQFENVVEMCHYDLSSTTRCDWDRIRNSLCPWATIKGDKLAILDLAKNIRNLAYEEIRNIAYRFDSVVLCHLKASGFEGKAEIPHKIPEGLWWFVRDIQLKDVCKMRAGTIVMLQLANDSDYFISQERFINSNSTRWGVLHELGHNMQIWPFCMEFGVNKMSGHEITANLWTVHTEIVINGGKFRQPSRLQSFRKAVEENLAARIPYVEMEWPEALTFFLQIYKYFGWKAFRETIRKYRELSYDDITDLSENPSKRVDYFYQLSSRVVGYDLAPHFDAYQIPLSADARETVRNSHLPLVSDEISKLVITEDWGNQ